MTDETKPLRKLPGRRRQIFGLVSALGTRLYLEDDHLLYVANERFTESYKRFYFRDIQALVFCRTNAGLIFNFVLGGLAGGCAVLDLLANWGAVGLAILGPLAFFFLLLLLVNVLKGPTCRCQLKTAVHTEELPSLNRVRAARKAFALLRPEIAAAQGQLTAMEAQAAAQQRTLNPATRGAPQPFFHRPPPPVKHEQGRFHAGVCYLLLMDSLMTGLDIFYDNVWLTLSMTLLNLALLGAMVVALVRQHDSDLGKGIRSFMWGVLGYQCLMLVLGFVFTIYLIVEFKLKGDNQWEMLRLWSMQSALESPLLLWALTLSSATSLAFGLSGLALLRAHRQQGKAPPVAAPTETP
jgi:hypothetical protein